MAEPVIALNGLTVRLGKSEILHGLTDLNDEGIGIVLTTHDLNGMAAHLPHLVCVNGHLVASGTPHEIITPHVLEAIPYHKRFDREATKEQRLAYHAHPDYYAAITGATKDWTEGTSSASYALYPEAMKMVHASTMQSQMESGGAWVGSPEEINAIIEKLVDRVGPFEHAVHPAPVRGGELAQRAAVQEQDHATAAASFGPPAMRAPTSLVNERTTSTAFVDVAAASWIARVFASMSTWPKNCVSGAGAALATPGPF